MHPYPVKMHKVTTSLSCPSLERMNQLFVTFASELTTKKVFVHLIQPFHERRVVCGEPQRKHEMRHYSPASVSTPKRRKGHHRQPGSPYLQPVLSLGILQKHAHHTSTRRKLHKWTRKPGGGFRRDVGRDENQEVGAERRSDIGVC